MNLLLPYKKKRKISNADLLNSDVKRIGNKKMIMLLLIILLVFFFIAKGLEQSTFKEIDTKERLVEVKEKPKSGIPSNYTPIENVKIAAGVLYEADYFEASTTGVINAMGIKQTLSSYRVKKGNQLYTESISIGVVKTAQQRFISNFDAPSVYMASGNIQGDKVAGWGTIGKTNTEDYFNKYGLIPRELAKYKINDSTILNIEAVDNFDQMSTGENETYYTYRLNLHPQLAIDSYSREVSTTAGSNQLPSFESIVLEITVDKQWTPVSVKVDEVYYIQMFGLSVKTTARIEEVIYHVNKQNDFPEVAQRFVQQANSNTKVPEYSETKSGFDYLMEMLEPMINGSQSLKTQIKLGQIEIDAVINMGIDPFNMDIIFSENEYITYRDNRMYYAFGDHKGYMSREDLNDIFKSLELEIDGLDSDLLLDEMTQNIRYEQNGQESTLSLSMVLFGMQMSLNIEAVEKDEIFSQQQITVNIGDVLELSASFIEKKQLDINLESHGTSNPKAFIDAILETINQVSFALEGSFEMNGILIPLTAKINILEDKAVNLDLTLMILEKPLIISLRKDEIYLTYQNLSVKTDFYQMEDVMKLIENRFLSEQVLSQMDIAVILQLLSQIDISEEQFKVNLIALGIDASVDMRYDAYLTYMQVILNSNNTHIKLETSLEVYALHQELKFIDASNSYSLDIEHYIEAILDLIQEQTFEISIKNLVVNSNDFNIKIDVDMTYQIAEQKLYFTIYWENTFFEGMFDGKDIYVKINNDAKFKLNLELLKAVLPDQLFEHITNLQVSNIHINNIRLDALNKVCLDLSIGDFKLQAALPLDHLLSNEMVLDTVILNHDFLQLSIEQVALKKGEDKVIDNMDSYIDIMKHNLVKQVMDIIENKSIGIDGILTFNQEVIEITGYAHWKEDLELNLQILTQGVLMDVKVVNSVIYVEIDDIRIKGSFEDIKEIIHTINEMLEVEILPNLDMTLILSEVLEHIKLTETAIFGYYQVNHVEIKESSQGLQFKLTTDNALLELYVAVNDPQETKVSGEYISVDVFKETIRPLYELFTYEKGLRIDVDGYMSIEEFDILPHEIKGYVELKTYGKDIELHGRFSRLFGQAVEISIVGDEIFLAINEGMHIKAKLSEIPILMEKINQVLGVTSHQVDLAALQSSFADINLSQILDALNYVIVDTNKLKLGIQTGSLETTLEIDLAINEMIQGLIHMQAPTIILEAAVNLSKSKETLGIKDENYIDIINHELIETALDILKNKRISLEGAVTFDQEVIDIKAYAQWTEYFKAHIELVIRDVLVDVMVIDKVIYVEAGNIRINGSVEEVKALLEAVCDILKIETVPMMDIKQLVNEVLVNATFTNEGISSHYQASNLEIKGNNRELQFKFETLLEQNTVLVELHTVDNGSQEIKVFGDYLSIGVFKESIKPIYEIITDEKGQRIDMDGYIHIEGFELLSGTVRGYLELKVTDSSIELHGRFSQLFGQTVALSIVGDEIYLAINEGISIKGKLSDIPSLIESIHESLGSMSSDADFKALTIDLNPMSLNQMVEAFKYVILEGNILSVGIQEENIEANLGIDLNVMESLGGSFDLKLSTMRIEGILTVGKSEGSLGILRERAYLEVTDVVSFVTPVLDVMDDDFYDIRFAGSLAGKHQTYHMDGTIVVEPKTPITDASFPNMYLNLNINTETAQHILHILVLRNEQNSLDILLNYNDMVIQINYHQALRIVRTVLGVIDIKLPILDPIFAKLEDEPIDTSVFDSIDIKGLNELRVTLDELFGDEEFTSIKDIMNLFAEPDMFNQLLNTLSVNIEENVLKIAFMSNDSSKLTELHFIKEPHQKIKGLEIYDLMVADNLINFNLTLENTQGSLDALTYKHLFNEPMNFNTIFDFLIDLVNTADLSEFEVKNGTIKASALFSATINFDLQVKIMNQGSENQKVYVALRLKSSGFIGVLDNFDSYLYYDGDNFYLDKWQESGFILKTRRLYRYQVSKEAFTSQMVEHILFLIPFVNGIDNQIRNGSNGSEEKAIDYAKVLKGYEAIDIIDNNQAKTGTQYALVIGLAELMGSSGFSDLKMTISSQKVSEDIFRLSSFNVNSLTIFNLISITTENIVLTNIHGQSLTILQSNFNSKNKDRTSFVITEMPNFLTSRSWGTYEKKLEIKM